MNCGNLNVSNATITVGHRDTIPGLTGVPFKKVIDGPFPPETASKRSRSKEIVSENSLANERTINNHELVCLFWARNTLVYTARGIELLAYLLERVVQPAQDSCLS
jgi:hypothetical protein